MSAGRRRLLTRPAVGGATAVNARLGQRRRPTRLPPIAPPWPRSSHRPQRPQLAPEATMALFSTFPATLLTWCHEPQRPLLSSPQRTSHRPTCPDKLSRVVPLSLRLLCRPGPHLAMSIQRLLSGHYSPLPRHSTCPVKHHPSSNRLLWFPMNSRLTVRRTRVYPAPARFEFEFEFLRTGRFPETAPAAVRHSSRTKRARVTPSAVTQSSRHRVSGPRP